MLANWVKESTTTTGTGTITLGGAFAGYVTFASQCDDGRSVCYTIEDGVNRESGYGTFTASGTTLTRVPQQTLVAGTLNTVTPTAINLSGSAIVTISADVYSLGMTQWPNRFGRNISASNINTNGGVTNAYSTVDTLYVSCLYFDSPFVLSKLSIEINTAGSAGEVGKIGIWPLILGTKSGGNLIYETTDILLDATSFESHTVTSDVVIPRGWTCFGFVSESATARVEGFAGQAGVGAFGAHNDGAQQSGFLVPSLTSWKGAGSLPTTLVSVGNADQLWSYPRMLFNAVGI